MFKLWSEVNPDVKNILKPNFGLRSWDDLSKEEKRDIWKHLQDHFFEIYQGDFDTEFRFHDSRVEIRIEKAIGLLNDKYKAKLFARRFFELASLESACRDFYEIWMTKEADLVIELLSFYCVVYLNELDFYVPMKSIEVTKEIYDEEKRKKIIDNFKWFTNPLNTIFRDYGVHIYLTEMGFMPRQEEKIIADVYEPVLKCLANTKFEKISNLFRDAFSEYRKNTPNGYSTCVTHVVAAVEAFLQLVVKGQTGAGDFSDLIVEGQKKGLLPSDKFTKEVFKSIVSILMRERKETGDAHVKNEYATEKNAKMVLNLSMVFIQHCIII
jgi:hypothetical protein